MFRHELNVGTHRWGVEHGYEDGTFTHVEDGTTPPPAAADAPVRSMGIFRGQRGVKRGAAAGAVSARPPTPAVNVEANASGLTARLRGMSSHELAESDLRQKYPVETLAELARRDDY